MKATHFSLTKKTGTYADTLAAMGLARLLYLLSSDHPLVRDDGAFYTVEWTDGEHDLDTLSYRAVHDDPGYRYVLLKDHDIEAVGLPHSRVIDYMQERERLQNWREQRDILMKAHGGRRTEEVEEALKDIAPMKGWLLYQNINVLQGFTGYNALHSAIRASDPEAFAVAVRSKLVALAEERDPATVDTTFAPRVSAVQVFNPSVGKGINRPKPDGPALGGLPSAFVDWFEEWLRYIGVHLAANALSVGDDIKLFVIAPANVDEEAADAIRDDFVSLHLPWSSVKIDILGALGLVGALIRHSQRSDRESADDWLAFLLRSTPSDIISGLQTAYFTNLGGARALTNMAFIGLPGWFRIQATDEWNAILEEHERVVKLLNEDRSEEAALLIAYRNFLSAGERGLNALLAFLASYAPHLMQARERVPPQFTTTNLRRLIGSMGTESDKDSLRSILDNEGFQNIAAAIRRATVNEQFYKARTSQQDYEIHYGLFQDLERKARFKDQFVAALTAFVTDYNTENARLAERRSRDRAGESGGRRRPQITTDDLEHMMALLDKHKPELVAMLLVAYGSAREPRETSVASVEAGDTATAVEADVPIEE